MKPILYPYIFSYNRYNLNTKMRLRSFQTTHTFQNSFSKHMKWLEMWESLHLFIGLFYTQKINVIFFQKFCKKSRSHTNLKTHFFRGWSLESKNAFCKILTRQVDKLQKQYFSAQSLDKCYCWFIQERRLDLTCYDPIIKTCVKNKIRFISVKKILC